MNKALAGMLLGCLLQGALLSALHFKQMGEPESRIQSEAVEANVAEWQVDPKTGETSFVWRKCQ